MLVNAIPISPYTVIGLSIRAHAIDIGASGKFEFLLKAVNPSPEDGQDFVGTTLATSNSVNENTQPPELIELSSVITNPQAPFMRVILRGTGPSSGNLYAVLSADITAKTG